MQFVFIFVILTRFLVVGSTELNINSNKVKLSAFTYYNSYPECCPDSPNYSPSASTDECDDYSGCKYMGDLAAFETEANPTGHASFQYITTHNLIAFYDNSDPKGINFHKYYANKTIEINKEYNGKYYKFNATIADTCGNSDCNDCCRINSQPTGYLIDMEYYTVMNNFQTLNAVKGELSFRIF